MKQRALTAIALALLTSTSAYAESSQIMPGGSRPSMKGPEASFTGSVTVDPLYSNNEHTSNTGGHVTFEPGARSAWHTHPAGQVLIVTTGTGWIQEEGGEKHIMRAGDVIWCPPDVKHWHGATATNGVGHIAITNMKDGNNVVWLEKVSDEQYLD
jgi:quercetin dioxygenase-like cupin family protein